MVQPVSWGGKTMTCGGKSVEMLQTCSVATMAAVKGKFIMIFFFSINVQGFYYFLL